LGCVGMSMDDFDRCTPSEFSIIAEQWRRERDTDYRAGWEQARFIATCALQPYSRKALKPADVAQFPWERNGPEVEKGHGSLERMRELEERLRKKENNG